MVNKIIKDQNNMDHEIISTAYILTNVIAIAIAITAMIWPTAARVLLSVIFVGAFALNMFTAILNPNLYLEFGELTPNEFYRSVILGPFSKHTQLYIVLIAISQLFIGVFISYKGKLMTLAMVGGIVFLVAISPLGFGAAFPSTVILASALAILMFKRIKFNIYEIIDSRSHARKTI
jgi:hypothetical protein